MSPETLIEIAQTSIAAGEHALGRRFLKQALDMSPGNIQASLCLASLELQDNSPLVAMNILSELWKSTQNVEIGHLILELSSSIIQTSEHQKEEDRKVIARLAGLLKVLHGKKGVLVDTLQYDVIGGLALDALALVPVYRAGLTKRKGKPVVFFSGNSANPALVEMISRELPVFTDDSFPRLFSYTTYDWASTEFKLDSSFSKDFFGRHAELFKDVVEFTHSTNGRSYCASLDEFGRITALDQPTVSFSLEEEEKGGCFLRNVLGLPDEGWFVCVYARDAAYYNETPQSPNWFRNSDICTFRPAIEQILARGGYVVRIGEKTDQALHHPDSRFFDYSNSEFRDPFLDIYLLANCRFMLGTPSGLCHVANIFKTPQLLVNSVSIGTVSSCNLYLPKIIRDACTNQIIPFARFMELYYGYGDTGLFAENGINQEKLLGVRYEDNSPEDIASAVLEMMNRQDGRHIESLESAFLRERFRQAWMRWNPTMADTPVASFFMEKYPELFL